jgi:hypothetical protein
MSVKRGMISKARPASAIYQTCYRALFRKLPHTLESGTLSSVLSYRFHRAVKGNEECVGCDDCDPLSIVSLSILWGGVDLTWVDSSWQQFRHGHTVSP